MQPAQKPGLFLTFEGLDGSGKTTQLRLLGEFLDSWNLPWISVRQPGGTAIGDKIRSLLLDSKSAGMAPLTELAMMFADRAQVIQEVIAPALAAGKIVVCDRFTDSTEAYQGGGRQLGSDIVLELHARLCGNLQPDLTILLVPPIEKSLKRARRRNTATEAKTGRDEGRFEAEQDAFFRRVEAKFLEIAQREHFRFESLIGDLHISEVAARIQRRVEQILREKGHLSQG